MAETKEELIIEINVEGATGQLAGLRQELDKLIDMRQELNEKSKQGDLEATKDLEKLNSVIRNTQTEYKAQQRVLDGYTNSVKSNADKQNFANNSIQTNRDLLKQLTAQYIQLKNPSQQATDSLKKLSDTLKQQEAAIGNTSRNVGNYKEAFVGAFQTITSSVPALKGFQTAQLGVNAAMNANPAGAVVLIFQALYEIFQQNAEVADQVSFAIDGVTKAIGAIVDGVVDTITNFDKFAEALKNPIKFLFNLGKNAAIAAEEGYNAAKAIDALSEASATANAEIEKNNVLIQKNTDILKTRTATVEERKKAAKEIADLERLNAQESIKIAQSELEAEQLRLKGKTKSGAESARLITLQGKLDAATLTSQTINEGYNRRISQLLQKEGQERDKLATQKENEVEKEFEAQQRLLDNRNKYAKQLDEDNKKREADRISREAKAFNEENTFLQKQLELDLKSVDLSVASEEEKVRRKQEIQVNSLERQLDLAIQFLGADGEITRAELQGIETIKQAIQSVRQSVGKKSNEFKAGTLGDALGVNKDSVDEISQNLQAVQSIVNGVQDLANNISQAKLNNIENERNAEIDAVNASVASEEEKQAQISEINKRANREKYEAEKAAFETNKATAIILAIINTAQAIIAQFSNPTPYAGIVLAALAAATGAAQIAVIASTQPPPPPSKFAGGVIGLDGEGTETSDSIDARLSKGESVMTAKATRRFHRELAAMELSVGNKPNYQFGNGMFATGFIPSDGGFVARSIAKDSDNALMMQQAIRQGFALAPAPTLSIVEFQSKQDSRNRSVKVSEA